MDGTGSARLRAVLFTDVVGSSDLRSRLGDAAADRLRRDHDQLTAAAIAAHHGVVLRWTGDGVKASFPGASAAVAAAVDLQRAVARYPRSVDAVAPFQIRIGVAVGEVTWADDDEHGVAVIEAARLEALAEPGQTLATDLVARLGQRRVEATFEEVGVRSLKGLDHPVTVMRVIDSADGGVRPLPRALVTDRRFPMVGRARELATARRRWDEVAAGAAATVLVAGHPGLGKSRFLTRVAAEAHEAGAVVLAGVSDSDLAVPYQPFAMAFADAAPLDEELAAAVAEGAGPLGALFPTRRGARADDPGPAARFELFESVAALTERLAHDQPLVLVLEDLHWAAPSTVQLLRHLVRRADDARVLILASYRAEEIGPSHPLQDLLAELASTPSMTRIELGGLAEAEVGELVAARFADAAAATRAEVTRRIHHDSGGSPFFVCELLHHLGSTGALDDLAGGADHLPLPDSVRDVVGQRLGRLPESTRDLLTTAATVGLSFDLELLAAAVDRDPATVLEDLEAVARVALVDEVGPARFAFTHALVRTALLDQRSATRAALLHRRVATAIVALARADFDELARHWRLAGDEEQAVDNVEQAARRDLEALAYESALDRYLTVAEHRRRRTPIDAGGLARAVLGVGLARRALGQPEYLAAVQEAGRIGRRLRDPDLVADAAVASTWPGTFFIIAGRTDAGLVELCEDALDLLAPDDHRRTRILSTLASHLTFDRDRTRREALLAEAHERARAEGDPELIGTVQVADFLALWDPSTIDRREELVRGIARMARASGDNDLEFFGGFFAAVVAAERGDLAASRERLDQLGPSVAASRNFYFGFLAERLVVSLDIAASVPGVQADVDALAARYEGTHADTSGTWGLQTGGLARQAGTLGSIAPLVRSIVDGGAAPNWRSALGLALLESGDRAGAEAVLDAFVEPPLDYFWLTTMQTIAELAVGLGRTDRAAELLDLLAPYDGQVGVTASGTYLFGLVGTTIGLLAAHTGDHPRAVATLERALARADAIGAPFEATRTRRLLATSLAATAADPHRVATLVGEATALAERHGFAGEAALLSAGGPASRSGGRRPGAALPE